MQDKFLTDVGENYEYVRTIIDNKIKLVKIEAIELTSKVIGYLMIAVFVLSLMIVFLGAITALIAFALFPIINSWLGSIALATLFPLLLIVFIVLMKNSLIIEPIAQMFYNKTKDKL